MMMRQLKMRQLVSAAAMLGMMAVSGCWEDQTPKPQPKKVVFEVLPPKEVPEVFKGTIFQLADSGNKDPFVVGGYGLVVGLAGTGNNRQVPLYVKNFMIREMLGHGYGSVGHDLEGVQPERVLADSRTSIVEVYGVMPPGARKGQAMDVVVQACTGSETTSLARGTLFRTDMFINGVDPMKPFGNIHSMMVSEGPLFVNPGYAVAKETNAASAAGATKGSVIGGGRCMRDLPLLVKLRDPSMSVARAIEFRIQNKFNDKAVARMMDESKIYTYVPLRYEGDWQHFLGVAMHLYINQGPGFGAMKAKELADEALKPGAMLNNISYAWEGLGDDALPFVRRLYGEKAQDVAFAAARAGACIGDDSAAEALRDMAMTEGHSYQVEAIKTMRFLSDSPRINSLIKQVLQVKNAQAKIEAYRILSDRGDPSIITRLVGDFHMDRILTEGKMMVYARRTGSQRLAIFGQNTAIDTNIMYSVLNNKFTLTKSSDTGLLMAFDRSDPRYPEGRQAISRPDLADLVVRLGGSGTSGLGFSYAEVLGVIQGLTEKHRVVDSIVVEELQQIGDEVDTAPPIELTEEPTNTGITGQNITMPGSGNGDDKLGK